MNDFYIHLTDKAIEKFNQKIDVRNTPDTRIRLGVSGSGACSGYKYVIEFDDERPREKDFELFYNGIRVVVDKRSMAYLNGCTLDYIDKLMESGFVFVNQRETKKCGCGKSFQI